MGGMSLPPHPWPTGAAEQLEPLVRRVLATNPSPYTFTGTQTYLVGDGDGVVVIDPGPADAAHLDALVAAIGGAPVLAIACTHTHRDHSPAAAPLAARTGAPVIGCAPLVIEGDGPRLDDSFDASYAPDAVLADGEVIAGPGFALRAVATPGHTSNHLCYALEVTGEVAGEVAGAANGALFTGDHVMGWSTSVVAPPDGNMSDYLISLDRLHGREDRVYYPAHGPQIDNPRQFVRSMIGHRRQRERQILTHLADGGASVQDLVGRMYKGLAPALMGAAGLSVLAHLIDLEARALAWRQGDRWAATGPGGDKA
ncbi:MAG TPA: MBL fold metallo-hydrolase [Novosphingobium sp.]|nr:MBL fold metallo-hydrolase [Novosphingobium sp.]